MDTLIIPRASTQELYNAALGAALHAPYIWDTDEVLQNDPSAYEKMRSDAVISHLVLQRKHEVAGLEWFLEPASQSPDDKRLAKILEALLKTVANFPTARINLAEAILRGSAWAGIRGSYRRMAVADMPAERWWTVSELVDMDKRRFRQQHVEEPGDPEPRFEWFLKRPYTQQWEVLHREWYVQHTYGEEESSLHFGKGLSKAISYYWWLKSETIKLAAKYLDRWALGMLSAKVGLDPQSRRDPVNSARVQSWLKTLKAMREGYALVYDKEDEIELKESSGVGFDAIKSMLEYFDGSLRVLLLGSSLPTAPDAQGGSYAMAKVQAAKSRSLIRFDRALLEETLTRDVVKLLMRANWATIARIGLRPSGIPQFKIRDEDQDDPLQRAQVITQALGMGLPVRREDIYTQLQLTPPAQGDEILDSLPGGGDPLADQLAAFTDQRQGGATAPPERSNVLQSSRRRGRVYTVTEAIRAAGLQAASPSSSPVQIFNVVQPAEAPKVEVTLPVQVQQPRVQIDARSTQHVTVPERRLALNVSPVIPERQVLIHNDFHAPARAGRKVMTVQRDQFGTMTRAEIETAPVDSES